MEYVTRIHLKTGGNDGNVDRKQLIRFCLHNPEEQFIVIGWSCVYESANQFKDYKEYYYAVKEYQKKYNRRINAAHNCFWDAKVDDLFWTRDLDGYHWICRVKKEAYPYCDTSLDIGAVIPVEAYKFGLDVPGQIRASFSRSRGGIIEKLKDKIIVEYSRYIFNMLSKKNYYTIKKIENSQFIDNLPSSDLEELIISYIQINEGYYVLSNSIAKKSTTIKIECEFRSRYLDNIAKKAVVQVKGGKDKNIDALEYAQYEKDGYIVYFYAPHVDNLSALKNAIRISKDEIIRFYHEYKAILPESITKWEKLFM